MRRLALLLGALTLSVGALVWLWGTLGDEEPAPVPGVSLSGLEPGESARVAPVVLPPPPTPQEELAAVAESARALIRAGRVDEAVLLLEAWRKRVPAAFEASGASRLLRDATTPKEEPEAEEERGVGRRLRASRLIVAKVTDKAARRRLERHVDRFVPRGDGEATQVQAEPDAEVDWLEDLFEAQVGTERTWSTPTALLGVADAEAAEARRVAQLGRLAARGATELLEPVHGALLWLALHQGDDGRISDTSVIARCKALGHGAKEGQQTCMEVWKGHARNYDTASTALSLLAFLDFRDQDARAVFEPSIAQATRWLRTQQKKNGLFPGGREFYTSAIALMALAQAASAADSDELRAVVGKGLAGLYAQRGPLGGYRYRPKQPGDISVSGWVAQAVEAARAAEAPIPMGMEEELRRFFDNVWVLKWRFRYQVYEGERSSLYPVGMLIGHILWTDPEESVLDTWRTYLGKAQKRGPKLYTLYYGLRMSLLLEERLVDPWRSWVVGAAGAQIRTETAVGMFPPRKGEWLSSHGPVVQAAFTTLTLEHALYER